MNSTIEESNFRKKINKINNLRFVLREKKSLLAKLTNIPEALEESLKLQSEVKELESQIDELLNYDDVDSKKSSEE